MIMIEENKNRLINFLADVEAKETKERIEKTKKIDEQYKFLADFADFCHKKIKPIMSEIGTHLRKINCLSPIHYIEEEDSKIGIEAPYMQMGIIVSVKDCDPNDDEKNPHIRFVGDKYTKEIQVYQSTMSYLKGWQSIMKKITYTFDTLSQEAIEKEIVESIENIISNQY